MLARRCFERGLVYSNANKTCRVPVPVSCGEAGPPLGAAYTPVSGTCRGQANYGSTAGPCNITCNVGYVATGSAFASYSCGLDGNWFGGPPPTCTGSHRSVAIPEWWAPTRGIDVCIVGCSLDAHLLPAVSCGTISLTAFALSSTTATAACTGTTFGRTCTVTCNVSADKCFAHLKYLPVLDLSSPNHA